MGLVGHRLSSAALQHWYYHLIGFAGCRKKTTATALQKLWQHTNKRPLCIFRSSIWESWHSTWSSSKLLNIQTVCQTSIVLHQTTKIRFGYRKRHLSPKQKGMEHVRNPENPLEMEHYFPTIHCCIGASAWQETIPFLETNLFQVYWSIGFLSQCTSRTSKFSGRIKFWRITLTLTTLLRTVWLIICKRHTSARFARLERVSEFPFGIQKSWLIWWFWKYVKVPKFWSACLVWHGMTRLCPFHPCPLFHYHLSGTWAYWPIVKQFSLGAWQCIPFLLDWCFLFTLNLQWRVNPDVFRVRLILHLLVPACCSTLRPCHGHPTKECHSFVGLWQFANAMGCLVRCWGSRLQFLRSRGDRFGTCLSGFKAFWSADICALCYT